MATQFERFKGALEKMLMLDQADLDFGIYRIMNQKRTDIEKYLNNELKKQVTEAVSGSSTAEVESLKAELVSLIKTLTDAGIDPETSPKVKDLRAKLSEGGDTESLENEVYSHLTTFFSRYYDSGDFISQRRYKKDVYAIPYEGEEVKLHWANADQYYIKSSEYYRSYKFSLSDGKSVEFTLKELTVEEDNAIAQNNMERRFAIYEEQPIEIIDDILHINFTYEFYPKTKKQKDFIDKAYDTVKDIIPSEFARLFELKPTDKDRSRTLLQKHLNDYVARNTFDYFIHKDLNGFLSRELDFFIKNDILVIDDIDAQNPKDFVQHLSVIKAIKTVGKKIITFLASLEDFQKKLWLKKKFVVQADYCITLDRVPEELYPEICANDKQREEWVKLFAIDEIKTDAFHHAYSIPLTEVFLKENPSLVLDTAFFSFDFKKQLLSKIDNLDEQCNGLLVKSDNRHALGLIKQKYANTISAIYIDPPYNTGSDGFVYKDNYLHSSWLTMMNERLLAAKALLSEKAPIAVSINENELYNLKGLMDSIFNDNYYTNFTVKVRHEDRILKGDKDFHEVFENCLFYANSKTFKPLKRQKDNTSIDDYKFIIETAEANETIDVDGKIVEVFSPENFKIIKKDEPSSDYLKPISIRGSIREGNSSGRFYVANIEGLPEKYDGYLFKVPNMGDDKYGFRYFWKPSKESGRKNGDYYQGKPLNGKDYLEIPFPNYVDFESAFNDATNEGGLPYRNGKKPIAFVDHILRLEKIVEDKEAIVLDFFAGSATTGHAVIELNKHDNGNRKYVLMQIGDIFDNISKVRMQNSIYSPNWKDGKPISREGISHCFKYMRLEQFDDTLNNLVIKSPMTTTNENGEFYDGYMLGYLLDTETKDSLFNLEWFRNPWNTKLFITRQNETKEENIDLIETFNYLIGLNVETILYPKEGICTVEGVTRSGERTLVIWRNVDMIDNEALNKFFEKQAYSTKDSEFDRIYVNGDCNLENLRTDEESWKVVLTEKEFAKRMFEDC